MRSAAGTVSAAARSRTRWSGVTGGAVVLVALAACSSPAGSAPAAEPAPASSASSSAPSTAATSAAAGADLKVASTSLGSVVVDSQGRTAYYFDKDKAGSGTSVCSGDCLAAWPAIAPVGS